MTPATSWHPDEPQLQAYVDGRPGGLSAASVEAHLLACGGCRSTVRAAVPDARLAAVLAGVEDRLDGLERSWVERLVCRIGMSEPDARALLAAPNMRLAWWGAVLAAAVLALLVAQQSRDPQGLFLLLAPLLPMVSTAAAYAPGLDPARSIVSATPYLRTRMLLARSLAVGVTALLGVGAAAFALPERNLTAVAWLLPAVALTLVVLALSPWLGTGPATGVVAGGWVTAVSMLHGRGVETLAVLDRNGQLLCAALAALALATVVDQWTHVDQGGHA